MPARILARMEDMLVHMGHSMQAACPECRCNSPTRTWVYLRCTLGRWASLPRMPLGRWVSLRHTHKGRWVSLQHTLRWASQCKPVIVAHPSRCRTCSRNRMEITLNNTCNKWYRRCLRCHSRRPSSCLNRTESIIPSIITTKAKDREVPTMVIETGCIFFLGFFFSVPSTLIVVRVFCPRSHRFCIVWYSVHLSSCSFDTPDIYRKSIYVL